MKKYMILFIIAFGSYSCESFLDIKPKSEILGDKLFETPEGFEDALYGVYTGLAQEELYGKILSWYLPDLLAGYYIKENADQQWELLLNNFNYTGIRDRDMFDDIWIKMYENISYVNDIIQNIDGHKEFKYYKFYKGEALGLRAFMHFDLCNCFAPAYREDTRKTPAIPYGETYEPLVYPFRSVEAIYEKVIEDLKMAESLLQDEPKYLTLDREGVSGIEAFMTERQFHMNLYAVQGLLARVYQMRNDLDSAMIYAEKVIRSGKFDFADKTNMAYEYASRISPQETIWGIYPPTDYVEELQNSFDYKSDDIGSALLPLNGFWIYPSFAPEGMGLVDYGFETLYSVPTSGGRQDYRYNGWFRQREGASNKHRRFYKIYRNTGKVTGRRGISMMRISEMYLIMAEGLLKKGQMKEAREYFDTYTNARGFVLYENEATFDMDLINKEYRKEFFGEGREWFNRKRQSLPIYPAYYSLEEPYPASDKKYVWPIPEDEFEYRNGGKEGVYAPETDEQQNN